MRLFFDQLSRLSFKDWLIIVMAFMMLGMFLMCKHYCFPILSCPGIKGTGNTEKAHRTA